MRGYTLAATYVLLHLHAVTQCFAFSWPHRSTPQKRVQQTLTELWVQEDVYEGDTFFDKWDFFNFSDPTHGLVNYVDKSDAFAKGLARSTPSGQVVMQMDNTTFLPTGVPRDSVRITSQKIYNGGLFILDLTKAPWGCSVWPAFWTTGANWPAEGEIDIFEGVHDNTHNQVTWHTGPNCMLSVPGNFSGTASNHPNCTATPTDNSGCAIINWSRASYGPQFDALDGGVYAMKWDNVSIAVWFFYRAGIPTDITNGAPDPSNWGMPAAELSPTTCNISSHFANHSIVFDITTCGDWAGSVTTTECPNVCVDTVQDPAAFVNASWILNTLKVYQKQAITGVADSPSQSLHVGVTQVLAVGLMLWLGVELLL